MRVEIKANYFAEGTSEIVAIDVATKRPLYHGKTLDLKKIEEFSPNATFRLYGEEVPVQLRVLPEFCASREFPIREFQNVV